ncbi:MAG: 3D domain-containing protein [Patescibacteria group bacterium]
MDIFSIIATVPMALNVSSVPISNPVVEPINTNTKIEFEIKKDILIANGKVINKSIPYNSEDYAPVKSEEDKKNEGKLNKWKDKQEAMWKNLPSGKFTINASAYTAAADECGKSDGITSSGLKVKENRTLACPPGYPFGAKVKIEGIGTLVCEDRGGAIKGNHFDIYMETKKQAFAFGRRNLLAEVVE